jgi:8-oxo-dGTP pyrophosphatase MutT (NUDIX family)
MFHFQKNNRHCNNCGVFTHASRDCPSPVTSFGTLLFRVNDTAWSQEKVLSTQAASLTGFEPAFSKIEVLLIQRRDSLGFVDMLRGKYSVNDLDYIRKQISGMTDSERKKIVEKEFEDLWFEMWGSDSSENQYKKDKENSKNKLLAIREGITIDCSGNRATLKTLVSEATTHWDTPEWGFPKGRRDGFESDLDCAMREMFEETGLTSSSVIVIHNLDTLKETFYGSNNVHYCHKYFVVYVPDKKEICVDEKNLLMKREIGDIGWFSLQTAVQKLRPDNIEKREILLKLGSLLRNFCPLLHPQ